MRVVATAKVHVTDELTRKFLGYSFDVNDLWALAVAGILVCGFGLYVARKASAGTPSKAQLLWEVVVGTVSDYVEETIGPAGRPVVPLAVTLFVLILTCNWLEVFFWTGHNPSYMPTPTSNVNIDYMMAFLVFVVTNAVAIKRAGLKRYLAHFGRSPIWLLPLWIIEELIKPITLSLRLFGNVFTGALVFALVSGLFLHFLPPVFFIDIIWLPFDLGIFLIQAFIFALLTIIYYQQAVDVASGHH